MVQVFKMGMHNSAERERIRKGPGKQARGAEGPGTKGHGREGRKGGGGATEQNGCGGMARMHETGDKAAEKGTGKRRASARADHSSPEVVHHFLLLERPMAHWAKGLVCPCSQRLSISCQMAS